MIPVIDLFAGPGGLGEGFSSSLCDGQNAYEVVLSVEKDGAAHSTLELRTFFRCFRKGHAPPEYYAHLGGQISREELYARFPTQAAVAQMRAWHAELGSKTLSQKALDERIARAIDRARRWVLIGGPPCQAYSVAGRSRNKGNADYIAELDARHFLYREYLRIIANHWPSVFVMENVKGLLSSTVREQRIFEQMLEDLNDPSSALGLDRNTKSRRYSYRIFSLTKKVRHDLFGVPRDPATDHAFPSMDFVIECEKYGIPQTRHRVILVGIRDDIRLEPGLLNRADSCPTVGDIIGDLPRLRSVLSREEDSTEGWVQAVSEILSKDAITGIADICGAAVARKIRKVVERLAGPRQGCGGEAVRRARKGIRCLGEWYSDPNLDVVCNSSVRAHRRDDLHRYIFAACYAKVHRRSPRIADFPEFLRPNHKNVSKAMGSDNFADRFRVQLDAMPASTVVSHIAKDGHYYIHYDPSQCRSLTVREAARLQTFPDNYYFCGSRTDQYTQVGNAVPPLLARQIADIILELLVTAASDTTGGRICA